ncbi:DNA-directed RNA polymerase, partial [Caligus rogercresseyi]
TLASSGNRKRSIKDSPSVSATLCAYVDCMLQVGELYLVSKAIHVASSSLSTLPLMVLLNFLRALAAQGQHPNEFKKIWSKYETQEKLLRPNDWEEPRAFMSYALCVGKFGSFPRMMDESLYLDAENQEHFFEGLKYLQWSQPSSNPPLDEARYNVEILSDLSHNHVRDSNVLDILESFQRQLDIERKGYTIVDSILHSTEEMETLKAVDLVREELCKEWKNKIKASLKTRLDRLKSSELSAKKLSGLSGYPFLSVLPLDTLADVAVEEATRLLTQSESYCPSVYYIQTDLGRKVFRRFEVASNLEPEFLKSFDSTYSHYSGDIQNINKRLPERPVKDWSHSIQIFVGRELLKVILMWIRKILARI